MKIKNLFVFASIILLGAISSAFVRPSVETTTEEKDKETFVDFLSHFEKIDLPYEITLTDFDNYESAKKADKKIVKKQNKKFKKQKLKAVTKGKLLTSPLSRTDFIPEVSNGRFSRMGPPVAHPIARFYPSGKTVAVIYTTSSRFSNRLDKSYKMVIYDLKGNIIGTPKKKNKSRFSQGESTTLAYSSGRMTQTCKIDKKGQIWINTYDNQWKNDLKKNGFVGNQLVGFDLKETKVMKINDEGFVKELKEIPSDARASLE